MCQLPELASPWSQRTRRPSARCAVAPSWMSRRSKSTWCRPITILRLLATCIVLLLLPVKSHSSALTANGSSGTLSTSRNIAGSSTRGVGSATSQKQPRNRYRQQAFSGQIFSGPFQLSRVGGLLSFWLEMLYFPRT